MAIKDLEIRGMTFDEFERYCEKLDELEEQEKKGEISTLKKKMETAKWVMKNIYDMDVKDMKCTAFTILKIANKTDTLTMKSEIEDEKNLNKSGIGELKEGQGSAKPAEKQQNSETGNLTVGNALAESQI